MRILVAPFLGGLCHAFGHFRPLLSKVRSSFIYSWKFSTIKQITRNNSASSTLSPQTVNNSHIIEVFVQKNIECGHELEQQAYWGGIVIRECIVSNLGCEPLSNLRDNRTWSSHSFFHSSCKRKNVHHARISKNVLRNRCDYARHFRIQRLESPWQQCLG